MPLDDEVTISDEPDTIADVLRRRVFQRISSMVREQLRAAGVSEEDVLADFKAFRLTRSRR